MRILIEGMQMKSSSQILAGRPYYEGTATVMLPDIQSTMEIPLSRETLQTIQEAVERDVDVALAEVNRS